MKIAVTGGAGFIGAAVIDELRARGMEGESFDLRSGFDVRRRFDWGDDIGGVIHLAGVLGTHELLDDIDLAIDTNIRGTINVLEACVRTGRRIPYVGISMPPVFPSVYTATKIAAGAFERVFRHEYHLPVVKVRAFNAFGPGQAHGPGHPQKILPTFAVEGWGGRPLPIWGDGTQTVDLISSDSLAVLLVEALLFAATDHAAVTDDIVFDGGTQTEMTVNQLAEIVNAMTGNHAGVEHRPMRRGEIPMKLRSKGENWGLLPVSSLPRFDLQQLRRAVDSYRNHPLVHP